MRTQHILCCTVFVGKRKTAKAHWKCIRMYCDGDYVCECVGNHKMSVKLSFILKCIFPHKCCFWRGSSVILSSFRDKCVI